MADCHGVNDIENSIWFRFVDINGDNEITRAEFHDFIKKVCDDDVAMWEEIISKWQAHKAAKARPRKSNK